MTSTIKRGVAGKEGMTFFQESCKIKIWNIKWQKKFISKNIFLCHN